MRRWVGIVLVPVGAVLLVVGVGGMATFAVWVAFFFDDPLAPPFSHSVAEELVAQELCPQAPDLVRPELIASQDSGYYMVYVRASPDLDKPSQIESLRRDTLASFAVGLASQDSARSRHVEPGSDESRSFLTAVRAACAEGRPPWPQLADR